MGFNMNLYLLCIFLVYLKQEIDTIIVPPPGIKSDHLVKLQMVFLNMYQNLHAFQNLVKINKLEQII